MAIWQISFNIVSENNYKNINLSKLKKDIIKIFWKILKEDYSYLDYWKYENDRCTIFLDDGRVKEIFCRIDLRIITREKIDKLFFLTERYDLGILLDENIIYWKEQFFIKLKNSNSVKFLKDPLKFFDSLK